MKHITDRHKVGWPEENKLAAGQIRIQHIITELDAVATRYEKIWGTDQLHRLVSDTTREKWFRQMDKLETALLQQDETIIQELAVGCIKGWQMMDAEARAAGHKQPNVPEAWLVGMGSRTLAIVATDQDAAVYHANLPEGSNTVVWTLRSISHVIGEKYQDYDAGVARLANSDAAPVQKPVPPLFDDDIPF